jgi:hypothetical protein
MNQMRGATLVSLLLRVPVARRRRLLFFNIRLIVAAQLFFAGNYASSLSSDFAACHWALLFRPGCITNFVMQRAHICNDSVSFVSVHAIS